MRWTDLVPSEFRRLMQEDSICVVPMGSLERHGEHLPFGCDLALAECLADMASEKEPCVVFPGYFLAQVHEASCFMGTVNLPQAMAIEALSHVLRGIALNGFRKIVILNFHGGNDRFLEYFAMSQMDEKRDYVLYIIDQQSGMTKSERAAFEEIWETQPLGHACEMETSMYMAYRPEFVRIDLAASEPVLPLRRFENLEANRIHNAHAWYANYPHNVVGVPGAATAEKGRRALELNATAIARALRVIKDDTVAPGLQEEFVRLVRAKKE